MITDAADAGLVAIVDNDPKKKQEAEQHYGLPFFSSLAALLESHCQPDVISVCTPNHLHASQTLLALQYHKHVICEKPMALSKSDCNAVMKKACEVNKKVFCVMQNRYSPPSKWLKEIIEKRLLGAIYLVQINCFWNRDERYYKNAVWKGIKSQDGGTLFTQFSHFIDIMHWLFGDITNIQARFKDFNHQHLTEFEDSGYVSFDFVNGGMGSIHYSVAVWNQNFESSITIIGEKGTVKVGGQYMNELIYCDIENYNSPELIEARPANDYGHYKGSAANHHFLIKDVTDYILGVKAFPDNTYDAMKVVDIIERIYAS